MGQSYVQVASQDLDQAPPPAQAKVDTLPVFDENDMMTESARREKRKMKQMENSGLVEGKTRCGEEEEKWCDKSDWPDFCS